MNEITCPQCNTTFVPEGAKAKTVAEINRAIAALEAAKAELNGPVAAAEAPETTGVRVKLRQTLDFLGLVEHEVQVAPTVQTGGRWFKIANALGLVETAN